MTLRGIAASTSDTKLRVAIEKAAGAEDEREIAAALEALEAERDEGSLRAKHAAR